MKYPFLLVMTLILNTSVFGQTLIDFYTTEGNFRVEVREDLMPITAGNMIDLVEAKFYDGVIFHRIIDGFVVQGGDPTGTGTGGPGYTIQDETHPDMTHDSLGVISMAKRAEPNSAGSQFFFTLDRHSFLDGDFAAFGSVVENLEVLAAIGRVPVNGNDRPIVDVVMDSVRIYDRIISSTKEIENIIKTEVYPNPFVESIQIMYELENSSRVEISIFDLQGRLVKTLEEGMRTSGIHTVEWDGIGNSSQVTMGTYYLSITSSEGTGIRKLLKIK